MLSFVLTRFLLSFFPCIRTIWHRNTYFLNFFCCFSSFLEKKVGIFGICWDISEILTDSESAFKSGAFEHLKTIVAWILGTRTLFCTQLFEEEFDPNLIRNFCNFADIGRKVLVWVLIFIEVLAPQVLKDQTTLKTKNQKLVLYCSSISWKTAWSPLKYHQVVEVPLLSWKILCSPLSRE